MHSVNAYWKLNLGDTTANSPVYVTIHTRPKRRLKPTSLNSVYDGVVYHYNTDYSNLSIDIRLQRYAYCNMYERMLYTDYINVCLIPLALINFWCSAYNNRVGHCICTSVINFNLLKPAYPLSLHLVISIEFN